MYFPGLAFETLTARNIKSMLCHVTPRIKRQAPLLEDTAAYLPGKQAAVRRT